MGEVIHLFERRASRIAARALVISREGPAFALNMRPAVTNLERIAVTTHGSLGEARSAAQCLMRMFPDCFVQLIDETGEAEQVNRGVVHVWGDDSGAFMIGHESRSGNSWGYFEDHASASAAVSAAYALRDRLYRECGGERCDVHVPASVLDLLNKGGGNAA